MFDISDGAGAAVGRNGQRPLYAFRKSGGSRSAAETAKKIATIVFDHDVAPLGYPRAG